ncbi:MAG: hypothetical protein WCJ09_14420 [Planctomycetota bacterium]
MKRIHLQDSRSSARSSGRSHPRRGTIIIIAMVILLIFMAISTTLIGSVIQTRTQFIREEQFLQTSLLVDAGLRRGVVQLRSDGTYQGEAWQIPADPAAGLDSAKIVIVVASAADAQGEQTVTATAEYPVGTPNPIRITRDISISLRESP